MLYRPPASPRNIAAERLVTSAHECGKKRNMCRLFGCHSREPGPVTHELFHAANALRVQSKEHPDGWGLGWYEGGAPRVVRSLTPAHGDLGFEKLSHFVEAQTIVAHVRKASVGAVAMDNTHPFQRGPWLFAHNGTLPEWDKVRLKIEEHIDPSLRREMRGETDSERCFLLFLTRLRARCDVDDAPAAHVVEALRETQALLKETLPAPASTNFLLTDGRKMFACRRGRTLFLSAPPDDGTGRCTYVAVASEDPGEPPPGEPRRKSWRLLPEESILAVDEELRLTITAT
jgi:predicted glutamine amidotransferase